jgi:hypothetical protein
MPTAVGLPLHKTLKIASALTYGILPRRLQVYLPLAHSSLAHYHMTMFLACSHPLI